jgi:hypothetical protein
MTDEATKPSTHGTRTLKEEDIVSRPLLTTRRSFLAAIGKGFAVGLSIGTAACRSRKSERSDKDPRGDSNFLPGIRLQQSNQLASQRTRRDSFQR